MYLFEQRKALNQWKFITKYNAKIMRAYNNCKSIFFIFQTKEVPHIPEHSVLGGFPVFLVNQKTARMIQSVSHHMKGLRGKEASS